MLCALACCAAFSAGAPRAASAQTATAETDARAEVRRTLREYLFLDAALGARYRRVSYADGAEVGPNQRGELRLYANGRYQNSADGPLSVYLGFGLVTKAFTSNGISDPLIDPFDDFDPLTNLRLLGAHIEYIHRNDERKELFRLRAGRLTDFDQDARFLLFDGLRGSLSLGVIKLEVYGGRRAVLDRGLPNDRSSAGAQLVTGAFVHAKFADVKVRLGHRFEEIHRPSLKAAWSPSDQLMLSLSGEALIDAREEGEIAGIVRLDGVFTTADGLTSITGNILAQLGTDPRPFGRGGLGPSGDEVLAAAQTLEPNGRLDRLFLGSKPAHVRGYAAAEHWLAKNFALNGGVFGRLVLDSEDRSNFVPQFIEGWLGGLISFSSGIAAGLEGRYSFEDPGDLNLLFGNTGDGLRRVGALRAWAELPWMLTRTLNLSFRPEVEGSNRTLESARARAEGQWGFSGSILASLVWEGGIGLALRYGAERLPEFGADGVNLGHTAEIWLRGSY